MDEQTTRKMVPSAANGATRLRRAAGGREHAIKVKLNKAEYQAISTRAADRKLSVQRFLLSCALAPNPAVQPVRAPSTLTAELAGLRLLTGNLANNINQIARKLNAGGWPDASIAPAADAVQRTMRRLDAALAAVGATTQTMPAGRPAQGPDPPDRPAEPEPDQPGTFRNVLPPQRNAPWMPG